MSMKFNTTLPSPTELKEEYPLSEKLAELKKKRDQEIRDIFTGKSDKFAVIIGPCSADNEDSVCEYVNRLAKVNEKVKDKLMIIPRIYTNKGSSNFMVDSPKSILFLLLPKCPQTQTRSL